MNDLHRAQFDSIVRQAHISPDTTDALLALIEQVAFTAFVNGVRAATENPT